MKVYVDELPKDCVNCDFGYANNFCEIDYEIDLRKFDKNQKHPNCPLQSIADYTKQVRKEVVEQVKDYMEKHSHTIPVVSKNRKVVYNIGLTRFLDKTATTE